MASRIKGITVEIGGDTSGLVIHDLHESRSVPHPLE